MKDDQIVYVFIDSRGNEELGKGEGVSRDVYSSFWKEIADSHFIGETERVPFVRHDLFESEWTAMADIYVKGYVDVGYIPLFISKSFIEFCLFGDINNENLTRSFLQYVSKDERETIERALVGEDEEVFASDEIFEILETFKCRTSMNKGNSKVVVMELARQTKS